MPGKKSLSFLHFCTLTDILTCSLCHLHPTSRSHSWIWPGKSRWYSLGRHRVPGEKSPSFLHFCTVTDVLTCSLCHLHPTPIPLVGFGQRNLDDVRWAGIEYKARSRRHSFSRRSGSIKNGNLDVTSPFECLSQPYKHINHNLGCVV